MRRGKRIAVLASAPRGSTRSNDSCISLRVIATPVLRIVPWSRRWPAEGNSETIQAICVSRSSDSRCLSGSFASRHSKVLYETPIRVASSFRVYPIVRRAWTIAMSMWINGRPPVSESCVHSPRARSIVWLSPWTCWRSCLPCLLCRSGGATGIGLPSSCRGVRGWGGVAWSSVRAVISSLMPVAHSSLLGSATSPPCACWRVWRRFWICRSLEIWRSISSGYAWSSWMHCRAWWMVAFAIFQNSILRVRWLFEGLG